MTEISDFSGLLLTLYRHNRVTGIRRAIEPEHLYRNTGPRFFNLLAVLIQHGADTPVLQTRQDDIALL